MAIEYTGFQRPSRLASTTRMAQAEFSGTLTFEPAGAGTRLRWSWDARFTWPLRLAAPVLARVGGRQERATWAGLKQYLESSQHAAGPGAGEQPGPAPAAAADGNGSQPPGQGRAGAALLAASVAGVALAPFALRRLGRGGSLLVAAGCGALFARDAQMTLTGAPARLRPLPRLLLRTEVPVSGSAAGAALLGLLAAAAGRGPVGRGSRRGDVRRPRRSRGHLPQPGSRQRGAGRPVEFGGMGRLDGPLGPLSAAGGIPSGGVGRRGLLDRLRQAREPAVDRAPTRRLVDPRR